MIKFSSAYTLNKEYNKKYKDYVDGISKITPFKKTAFINLFEEYKNFDLKRIYTFKGENGNPIMGISAGDINFAHPNSLGNAYIAKVLLKKLFYIDFNPETYIRDSKNDIKYPRF